jgi:hypothetical protein
MTNNLRHPLSFLLALMLLLPATLMAQEIGYELNDNWLQVRSGDESGDQVAVPCRGLAMMVEADRIYIACGADGLVTFSIEEPLNPRLLGIRDLGGPVTGLFVAQDMVWAQISRIEARPIDGATMPTTAQGPVSAVVPTAPARPPAEPAVSAVRASVIEIGVGQVVIDQGTDTGLHRGDHIELFERELVDLGDGDPTFRETRLAVGQVTAASAQRAQVSLGINERIPVGALARLSTREISSTTYSPRRMGGLWEVGFMIRPFLALGTVGFGSINEVRVGYRFDDPVSIDLVLDPMGIGLADTGDIVAIAGNVLVSLDTDAFQIGLGLGWSAFNNEDIIPDTELDTATAGGGGGFTDFTFDEVAHGMSLAQIVRLGARDGINFSAFNTFILIEDIFQYAGTTGTFQFPTEGISARSWMLIRFGAGAAGHVFGEIGLRILVEGNGDVGSVFLIPSLGGASLTGQTETTCDVYGYDPETGEYDVTEEECVEDVSYGGPMIGFGVEWRL